MLPQRSPRPQMAGAFRKLPTGSCINWLNSPTAQQPTGHMYFFLLIYFHFFFGFDFLSALSLTGKVGASALGMCLKKKTTCLLELGAQKKTEKKQTKNFIFRFWARLKREGAGVPRREGKFLSTSLESVVTVGSSFGKREIQ